jgi:hypothetical protein
LALSQTYQRGGELSADAGEVPPTSYRVALEKGLSSEQMARSLAIATGPWPDDKQVAKLKERCLKAFNPPPREPQTEFAPTVKGSLFLSHDSAVLGLLQRRTGNLIDRLLRQTDADRAAEELFMSVLTRLPSDEERTEFKSSLAADEAARESTIRQYIWAMFTSNEFAINH